MGATAEPDVETLSPEVPNAVTERNFGFLSWEDSECILQAKGSEVNI